MAVSISGPKFYAFNPSDGKPLAGGKLYSYKPGTSTEKPTFVDTDESAANTNPVILNAAGYASVFLSGYYDLKLYDKDDNLIWSVENFGAALDGIDFKADPIIESRTGQQIIDDNGYFNFDEIQYQVGFHQIRIERNGTNLVKNDDYTQNSSTSVLFSQQFIDDLNPTDRIEAITIQMLPAALPIEADAKSTDYDNEESGLASGNVQGAIDELAARDASGIDYDNEESGLDSDNVQSAIDELTVNPIDFVRVAESDTATVKSGLLVERTDVLTLARGSYTWWNHPISQVLGDVYQRTSLGYCDNDGSISAGLIDVGITSNQTKLTRITQDFTKDEHNSAITTIHQGRMFVFWNAHDDDGIIYMRRSSDAREENLGPVEEVFEQAGGTVGYTQVWQTSGGGTNRLIVYFRNTTESWDMIVSEDAGDTWGHYPLFNNPDGNQLYLLAQPTDSSSSLHRLFLTKNGGTVGNQIWEARMIFNTSQITVSTGSPTVNLPSRTTTASRIDLSDLNSMYTPPTDRLRLLAVQHSTNSFRMIVCNFENSDIGEYRYIEYDPSSGTIIHNSKIVDSGRVIGSGSYFGGACFVNTDSGGDIPVGLIYTAREQDGTWLLESYTTSDEGDTWDLSESLRERKDVKIWRPYAPINTRIRSSSDQIILTWMEGNFPDGPGVPGFRDFGSHIMGLKRFVKPYPLKNDTLNDDQRVAPVITQQPQDQSAPDNEDVVVSVSSSTFSSPWYQWQFKNVGDPDWTNSGATEAREASLTITMGPSADGRQYRCLVGNNFGYVVSEPATLTLT